MNEDLKHIVLHPTRIQVLKTASDFYEISAVKKKIVLELKQGIHIAYKYGCFLLQWSWMILLQLLIFLILFSTILYCQNLFVEQWFWNKYVRLRWLVWNNYIKKYKKNNVDFNRTRNETSSCLSGHDLHMSYKCKMLQILQYFIFKKIFDVLSCLNSGGVVL